MSTLPFLLSVADELDNINSQSYMDDFGLGFYPHRTAFHRTPTIQLSLPASTDWTSAIDSHHSHSRYRSHRYYTSVDTTHNNLQSTLDEDDNESGGGGGGEGDGNGDIRHDDQITPRRGRDERRSDVVVDARRRSTTSNAAATAAVAAAVADADANNVGASTSTAAAAAAATAAAVTSALNSNTSVDNSLSRGGGGSGGGVGVGGMKVRSVSGGTTRSGLDADDDEHIDTTVRMYNLSKKCCKNYYRHAIETGPGAKSVKCTAESNKSSSEESLQKVASPIEFLTCFLVKKSRTPKSVSSSSACGGGGAKKS